jgi:hypothetical protein
MSDPVRSFTGAARAAAEKSGCCLVNGWPQGECKALMVVLEPDEILRVTEALRPKLVYLQPRPAN